MRRPVLFIDRSGVCIDSRRMVIRGRSFPVGAIHEVRIIEEPPDTATVRVVRAAATVSMCALVVAGILGSLAARMSAMIVIAVALVVATCTARLRTPPVSMQAAHAGGTELLIGAEDRIFVNQVGRAMIRASEWSGVHHLRIYRVESRPPSIIIPVGLIAVVAVGAAWLIGRSLVAGN